MHDIFIISQTTYKRIWYCKAVNDGAERDHSDVDVKLDITSIKFQHNIVIKGVTKWTSIVTDEGYAASYCEKIKYLVDEIASHDNFNECTLKSGKQTATITKHKY